MINQIAAFAAAAWIIQPSPSFADSTPKTLVTSPGGSVKVVVGTTAQGRLSYAIQANQNTIVDVSPLGLVVDGLDLGNGASIEKSFAPKIIDETYSQFGAHSTTRNHCIETTIALKNTERRFRLVVRAYDDGVGLRYEIDGKVARVEKEITTWNLPRDGRYTWAEEKPDYEGIVHTTPWDQIPSSVTLPPPLTAEVAGYFVAVSEANCQDFPDMALVRNGDSLRAEFPVCPNGWEVRGDKVVSPWRATIVARDLTGLVNSDLIMNLCPAPDSKRDFSWVKPGRCLWQWTSIGAPLLHDQKDWFDAAARLKWDYYLIDDGWRVWSKEGKDQWALLKEVIAYGTSKGVKSLVWVDSKEMRTSEESLTYLKKIKDCGASGIKIDFFPPASPDVIRWQMNLLQQTADLQLLCNFHGAVKPTGLRRTWPHELTREAIRGDEHHMTRYDRSRPMQMDCNQPFNRLLTGPADLTPVVMNPKELRGYSWPHMFAQAITVHSPITHFYDHYQFYVESPMFDLFQYLPVVWDETRVLPGTVIGEVAGFARRKGQTWWLGIVNGAKPSELNIPLNFLRSPQQAVLIYDVPSKDDAVDRQEKTLAPADSLNLKLRPGGGFVARIGPSTAQ